MTKVLQDMEPQVCKESLRSAILTFLQKQNGLEQERRKNILESLRNGQREVPGVFDASTDVLLQQLHTCDARLDTYAKQIRTFNGLVLAQTPIVCMGAVVGVRIARAVQEDIPETEQKDTLEIYFLTPTLGGDKFVYEGRCVTLMTPGTPRAKCLWGKSREDTVECDDERIEILAVY